MTGICIPTSADIRIEVAGRRVAVVQSYRVEEEASCEVVGAIGSNEPVGVVRGPARYRITLQRVYATDEAISDGLRFHELRQFSLVIAKPDTMVVFSGCEWERLTERAEVGSSVLEEAVADGFCAAAAVGGAIASLSTPVVPLHDVALFGLQSLSALYTDDELDKLLQAGVTPVQLSGGRMCALRILTTRATAEGPEGESFRSLNATLVTDELLRDLRAARGR